MGFLNHATNNIIIDAVLTERGRELLANESFEISTFTFGDDEIDYSLITKYGLTIGKEKIEKNTPIFEANPNENIAIKYPLITYANAVSNLSNIPVLSWFNKPTNSDYIELKYTNDSTTSTTAQLSSTIEVVNNVNNLNVGDFLEESINDKSFFIKVHDELIKLSGYTSIDTDLNGVAMYRVPSSVVNENPAWQNQRKLTFTIFSYGVTTLKSFTKYSSVLDSNKINTTIQIIGQNSGATLNIPVIITKN